MVRLTYIEITNQSKKHGSKNFRQRGLKAYPYCYEEKKRSKEQSFLPLSRGTLAGQFKLKKGKKLQQSATL